MQPVKAQGTHSLILQGAGEPFVHPRLVELVSIVKDAGFHCTVLTNGTLLDEARIAGLVAARLDVLKVSLWATTKEEYRRLYPGSDPANLDKVLEGLQRLTRIKTRRAGLLPDVLLHFPINRVNFQSIDRLVDLTISTGCNGLSFSPFVPMLSAAASLSLSAEEERFVFETLRALKKRLPTLGLSHNIDQALLRYHLGEAVWETLPCHVAWYHARIRVDGTVQPCGRCDLSLGDLKEKSFDAIWNGPVFRSFRRQALSRRGMPPMGRHCHCGYCCYVADNMRVHRLFRLVAPLARPFWKTRRSTALQAPISR